MSPYNKAVPDDVHAAADKIIAGMKDGTYEVFTGQSRTSPARSEGRQGPAHGRTRTFGHGLVRPGRTKLRRMAAGAPICHARESGHPNKPWMKFWIPAFAGMTEGSCRHRNSADPNDVRSVA